MESKPGEVLGVGKAVYDWNSAGYDCAPEEQQSLAQNISLTTARQICCARNGSGVFVSMFLQQIMYRWILSIQLLRKVAAFMLQNNNKLYPFLHTYTILLGVGGTCYTDHTLNQFKQLGLDHQRANKLAKKTSCTFCSVCKQAWNH
eukprot:1141347-Pelagomonas_calceolata.AAC.1